MASKKQFNNAISLLDMALKLSPSDDLMKLRKAEFCIRVGKTGDAERISAGILRENRSNPEALYVRGTCKCVHSPWGGSFCEVFAGGPLD